MITLIDSIKSFAYALDILLNQLELHVPVSTFDTLGMNKLNVQLICNICIAI